MKIEPISDAEYAVSGVRIKNIRDQTFCVFDLEATGPNEAEDSIIQIGGILLNGRSKTIEKTFETLVKPSKSIPEVIERLTGIYNKEVEGATGLSEIYPEFVEFSKGSILVTQAGYEFDWPLLHNECKRNGLTMLPNTIMDTKALFTYLFPEVNEIISTNFLIKFFNIDDSDIIRHTALGDSVLIGRIFIELLKELEKRKIEEIHMDKPLIIKRVKLQKLL
ncbi:PolC-type DNA polymerase III [Paenibacillus thermoaerophilus]|uniref:PolC-type DNA polymerase III n=1 Tax=Paenibacillus thermoaerophilus TaxID=1215385 RepID=A0ABW2V5W9_9BACL|nr:3'-5' exonuclease [Paenibacillus thermoaerophilus]TMV09402.1 3'-5' exonuclease [Paenibacillus thermoaerophilus]